MAKRLSGPGVATTTSSHFSFVGVYMTIGIYCLSFTNINEVYIGQSSNIERRYKTHIRDLKNNTHSNYKLQQKYSLYGKPEVQILEISTIENLTQKEIQWIYEFDSINSGLNISLPGSSPSSGNSKYSKYQVLRVFRYSYLQSYINLTYSDIANLLNVSIDLIMSVRSGKTHTWLKEDFPFQYNKMKQLLGLRNRKITGQEYLVLSPSKIRYCFTNISSFAKEQNLDRRHLHKVIHGAAKSHKGWTLA